MRGEYGELAYIHEPKILYGPLVGLHRSRASTRAGEVISRARETGCIGSPELRSFRLRCRTSFPAQDDVGISHRRQVVDLPRDADASRPVLAENSERVAKSVSGGHSQIHDH